MHRYTNRNTGEVVERAERHPGIERLVPKVWTHEQDPVPAPPKTPRKVQVRKADVDD